MEIIIGKIRKKLDTINIIASQIFYKNFLRIELDFKRGSITDSNLIGKCSQLHKKLAV